ncbi:MAG: hypothetical protein Q4E75_00635 [bacterium]|nr:hypothetical protein [bacterium]
MKENRFEIVCIYICPFIFVNEINVLPNFSDYPVRNCVIDKEKNIVIDIETEQQYDFLPTVSRLFVLTKFKDKIKDGKRVGVKGMPSKTFTLDEIEKSKKIIKRLQNGEKFIDGNLISNEDYLKLISKEEIEDNVKQKKLK